MQTVVLSVVSAAAVAFVLGIIWYAPLGFGDTWVEATARRAASGSGGPALGASFAALVASAVALEAVLRVTGVNSVAGGTWVGALAGALVALAMLSDYLFNGWPLDLFAIQAGYRVAYLVLMGVVLGAWP
jgi:hypothetical protein